MEAIFMAKIGGRLMEIDRREIEPTQIYYCAIRTPMEMKASSDLEFSQPVIAKRERWLCYSKPVSKNGFAVFLLDGIE